MVDAADSAEVSARWTPEEKNGSMKANHRTGVSVTPTWIIEAWKKERKGMREEGEKDRFLPPASPMILYPFPAYCGAE